MAKPIHIANPLYDVVFRYMMEDNRVARLFLSGVLGKEVEELTFSPTEYSRKLGGEAGITVTRMDFSAKVREKDGQLRLVIIELQKAKYHHQIMRFRRYLGKQYQNPDHIGPDLHPLPIYPIYILGESFTQTKAPVIRVCRDYVDAATQSPLAERHPFIEALTHDATVIQAEYLSGSRRTALEQFLRIFDQSGKIDKVGHILALPEENYPEVYQPVVRRLQKALAEPKIEEEMELEDEVLNEFHRKDQQLAATQQQLEAEKERLEEALQREKTERKKAETAIKKEAEQQVRVRSLIFRLDKLGLSLAEIALTAQLSEAEVRAILDQTS